MWRRAALEFLCKHGRRRALPVIRVVDDAASAIYVRNKMRACAEVGFDSEDCILPDGITQEELIGEIEKRNTAPEVDGILLQLPIPKGYDTAAAIAAVAPGKGC